MPVENDTDRAIFVALDDFGVTAIFTGLSGQPMVAGIFDDDPALAGQGVGVQSSDPLFICRSSDLPALAVDGTLLTIDGVEYRLRNPQPDGTGMTVLQLERVQNA